MRITWLVLLGAACQVTVAEDSDGGPPDFMPCDAAVLDVRGTDGSSPVRPDVDVLVRFDRALPEDDWEVRIAGVPARSRLGADHTSVAVHPDDPLDAGTTYALEVTLCGIREVHDLDVAEVAYDDHRARPPAWRVPLDAVRWRALEPLGEALAEAGLEDLAVAHADHGGMRLAALLPDDHAEAGWARCGQPVELAPSSDHPGSYDRHRVDLPAEADPVHFEQLALTPTEDAVHLSGRLDLRSLPALNCPATGCLPCVDGARQCASFHGALRHPDPLPLGPERLPDRCPGR